MLLFFGQKVARISVFLISNYLLFLCKKTQTCLCYTVLAICMFIFCYCPSYTYLPTYTRAITIIVVTLIIGVMLCKHCTGSQTHDKRIQKKLFTINNFCVKKWPQKQLTFIMNIIEWKVHKNECLKYYNIKFK